MDDKKEKKLIRGYKEHRALEYPAIGEQLDIVFKERQKRKLLAGKAKTKLAEGDLQAALAILIELGEPSAAADALDGIILAIKRKYPKPDGGEE